EVGTSNQIATGFCPLPPAPAAAFAALSSASSTDTPSTSATVGRSAFGSTRSHAGKRLPSSAAIVTTVGTSSVVAASVAPPSVPFAASCTQPSTGSNLAIFGVPAISRRQTSAGTSTGPAGSP